MDTSWYLDVNRLARDTPWAHGFMSAYAVWGGITLLGLLLVAGWWYARGDGPEAVAAAIWAGAGTLVAVGLNQPLSHLVGRSRPYDVLRGVEVLVPRAHDFTFPSDHATAAGAVICGLFLAGRRWTGTAAAVVGAVLVFARVYVGAHYPGDVAGGLVFGAAVVAVLYPLAARVLLLPIVRLVGRTPVRMLVVARGHGATTSSDPLGPEAASGASAATSPDAGVATSSWRRS